MSARGSVRRHGSVPALLCAAVALAVVGAGMLVASADPRVLRLAVVTTMWAFLLTALVATRRHATGRSGELELRRAYEIELAREVAARREHELRLELQVRHDLEGALRADVDALRRDLVALHQRIVGSLGDEPTAPHRTALRTESTRLPGDGLRELGGNDGWPVVEEQDLPLDVAEIADSEPTLPRGVVLRWLPETPGALDATALPDLRGHRPNGTADGVVTDGTAFSPETVITSGFHTGDGWHGDGCVAEHNRPGHDTYGNKRQVPHVTGIGPRRCDCGAGRRNGNGEPGATCRGTRGEFEEGVVQGDGMDGDTGSVPGDDQNGPERGDGVDAMYGSSTSRVGARTDGAAPVAGPAGTVWNAEGAPPGPRGAGMAEAPGSGRDGEVSGEIVESSQVEDGSESVPASAGQPADARADGATGDDTAAESAHGRHYRGDDDTGTFVRMLGGKADTVGQPRHRRYREDDEENEVLTRILGR